MEHITASDVATMVYCPRKLWLIGEGARPNHEDVVRGEIAHQSVDRSSRTVVVTDDALGVRGVCDVVDGGDLVEYKSSKPGSIPVVREHHLAQLAVYRHCLQVSGEAVNNVYVWFTDQKRRTLITHDELNSFDVPILVQRVRDVLSSTSSPPVLEDDPRCARCSIVEVCQPSEKLVADTAVAVPLLEGRLLIIDSTMTSLKLRGGQVVVNTTADTVLKFPIYKVSGVVVLNDRANISTPLIVALLSAGKSVSYTRFGSIPVGVSHPVNIRNGKSRQVLSTLGKERRVYVAAEMVRAKVHNQAARVGTSSRAREAGKVIRAQRDSLTMEQVISDGFDRAPGKIFGAEGIAAREYFDVYFHELPEWVHGCGSTRRHGKGAGDPVNVLLNYGYAMLHGAVMRALTASGLDPAIGVLHEPSRGKPALVLDIGEQFRVPLVDTTVRSLLNNGTVREKGFIVHRGVYGMEKATRRAIIEAFTDKLASTHTYLKDSHEMSWERSIEYQIRSLLRYVDGSATTWEGLYVR